MLNIEAYNCVDEQYGYDNNRTLEICSNINHLDQTGESYFGRYVNLGV